MIRVVVHHVEAGWLAELIDTEPFPHAVYHQVEPTHSAAAQLCRRVYDLIA